MSRYDNMINIPRPKQKKPMSLVGRAAQFSAFAALTGYGEKVKETARLTDDELDITETVKNVLNHKLSYLNDHLEESHTIDITYFLPDNEAHFDSKKTGGEYITYSGIIKKIDTYEEKIIFKDGNEIRFDRIIDINCDIFNIYD